MTSARTTRLSAALLMIGVSLWPALAHANAFRPDPPFEPPFLKLAIALILCSLCALLIALYLKRRIATGKSASSLLSPSGWLKSAREVSVLETHRISLHADACRVSFDNKEFLIIVSQGGPILLHQRNIESASSSAAYPPS